MLDRELHVWTPTIESTPLTNLLKKPVFLKMECNQPVGSFKIRGIGRLCQEHVRAGKKHLVSSSGGNAGYATAYAGRKLGIPVTVFLPSTSHQLFINAIRNEQAEVIIKGDVWDEANHAALEYVKEVDGGYVPPFDHPTIWSGHATMIEEIYVEQIKPEAIVVSVGGGGLALGLLQGLHYHHWDDVPLICVETEGAAALAASLKADKLVTLDRVNTIATSLAAKSIAKELFNWTKKHQIISATVTDKAAIRACRSFLDDHRVMVEASCGAALSVIYDQHPVLQNFHSLIVIVCGGVGNSMELLSKYLAKHPD